MPLVQLPPRGTWRGSGGIVLDELERWTGRSVRQVTTEEVVRRYLRGFGPASARDVGCWSGVTGLRTAMRRMDDLVRHEDEQGTELFDVPEGEIVDAGVHAPMRLLGTYDNVWLSHVGRDRVTAPSLRARWMGANGGVASTIFVDGWLTGLWRLADGRVTVVELFRHLTPPEQAELDEEVALLQTLLSR
jgi:hypothetical protein